MPIKQCYFVVQEGGSSNELYLHTFNQRRNAQRYRHSCSKAAYRTSPIGRLPVILLDALSQLGDTELFEALFTLHDAIQEVDYP